MIPCVSKLVPLVVALLDIYGISFLTSCFWVTALLRRGVCSVSSSDVWFSSPILVFSSFFCSSCLCFGFSFEVLATAGPFFIRIYRNNDVIASCSTSLFLGRRGSGDPSSSLSNSSLNFAAYYGVIFSVVTSVSYTLLQLVLHVVLLCVMGTKYTGTELSGFTE